eukprot:7549301-Pyramimonas_sp.AAC.1
MRCVKISDQTELSLKISPSRYAVRNIIQYSHQVLIVTLAPNTAAIVVKTTDGGRLEVAPRPDVLVVLAVDVDPLVQVVRPVAVGVARAVLQPASPPGVDVAVLAHGAPTTAAIFIIVEVGTPGG